MDEVAERFVKWFQTHGSQHASIGLTDFPGMGRGAVALDDIAEDTVLFSIPRTLLLNTSNSKLQSLLKEQEWATLKNWTSLILTMMWESRQQDSLWKPYFDIMPVQIDSLMFWSEEELKELEGCAVRSKIGKEEALKDLHDIIDPLVASRPDVFGSADYYSEDLYNQMGSLILSRSFHVEDPEDEEDEEADESTADLTHAADESNTSLLQAAEGMDIHNENGHIEEDEELDDNEDVEEEVKFIAMVPWADMLNARHGCDNARLFYEKDCLNMTTTKSITKGEQIWNVYGDPPNSDLLRRYGHVDDSNPSDVAEITADLIAEVACKPKDKEERIDTLLEVDLDDTYTFTLDNHEDDLLEMLAAISVFTADGPALAKIQKKGKVSKKALLEEHSLLRVAKTIFEKRLSQYPHQLEDDESQLQNSETMPLRKRHALIVRYSEICILKRLIEEISSLLPQESAKASNGLTAAFRQRPMSKKELREEKKRAREEESILDNEGLKKSRR